MKTTDQYELTIIHEHEFGDTIELDLHETYTVGRHKSNNVYIPGSSSNISREHAKIFSRNGDWYFTNTSSFGSLSIHNDLDEKVRVVVAFKQEVKLEAGDRLKIERTKYSVLFDYYDLSIDHRLRTRDLDKETRVSKVIEIDKNTRIVSVRGKQNRLSPTEFKVLYQLYQNSEKICKKFKIKGTYYLFSEDKVVKNIYKIRNKLKKPILPDDVSKIVERIPYEGYRLNNEEQK